MTIIIPMPVFYSDGGDSGPVNSKAKNAAERAWQMGYVANPKQGPAVHRVLDSIYRRKDFFERMTFAIVVPLAVGFLAWVFVSMARVSTDPMAVLSITSAFTGAVVCVCVLAVLWGNRVVAGFGVILLPESTLDFALEEAEGATHGERWSAAVLVQKELRKLVSPDQVSLHGLGAYAKSHASARPVREEAVRILTGERA